MNDILSSRLREHSSAHWLETLTAVSIPCALVENIESVANSSIAAEYSAFSELDNGMRFVRNPIADLTLNETAAPELGEHTAEILSEIGYSDAEIEALETA